MTVSSEVSTAGPFFGNGSVKTFPYAFKILDEKHIRVVFISALGDVSDLSLANGDYTVTGVGNEAGGNVVKATPLLTGQTLTIVRRLPLTQDTSLENQGAYYPEVVEQRFDLLTMQIQSVQETTERSLTVEPGQEKPSMTLIAAAQGYSQAAKQSRDEAAGLASAAAGSASNASGSAVLASRWASEAENVPVAGGLFSAFHWYRKAYAIYQTITQGFLEKVGGILTGDVLFGPGTGGRYSKLQANGDVQLNRGDNTGYNTWNVGNAYFGWDGTRYAFGPAGPVALSSYVQVDDVGGLSAQYYATGDIKFSGYMATDLGGYLSTVLKGYTSAQQTWTIGGSLVVAHGLGRIPNQVWLILVCKSPISGYAVGDRVIVAPSAARDENYYSENYTAQVDATNVRIHFANNWIGLVQKGGGATGGGGLPANFDVIVVARL
ncbi:hypothetical protein [Agrobacterium cavarae]|uniref:hypothetical protein n=1 Tax=Agrobacterium cavarae TaxID=2528239 RepID=UPI003D090F70